MKCSGCCCALDVDVAVLLVASMMLERFSWLITERGEKAGVN
jgi:hypothetical protein